MKIIDELDRQSYRNVWTISECSNSGIHPVSYELLGIARKLAAERGCEVWTVAMGDSLEGKPGSLIAYGADKVNPSLFPESPAVRRFQSASPSSSRGFRMQIFSAYASVY